MSELIINNSERFDSLYGFASRLTDGENGKMLVEEYSQVTANVTPEETMQVLDALLVNGYPLEKVKSNTGKIINVFYKSLSSFRQEMQAGEHFLNYLMLENRGAEKLIAAIRPSIRAFLKGDEDQHEESVSALRDFILRMKEYELHYIKKENILFPYIERIFPQYRCLKLMWSFHDDFRRSLKELALLLQPARPDREKINKELGRMFFVVFPIIFREEHIVFPVALKVVADNGWKAMLLQSIEAGWCFGVNPGPFPTGNAWPADVQQGIISLGTGFLSAEQIMLMLNNLPVDITFVDETDEVRYFSVPGERIFPRSEAIIGRKVQNCHPASSVHIVEEIIAAFRAGRKNNADFHIQIKGRFIHIRYFAVRNASGDYKGTIEVSQDVTDIRSLQGEKRLLDWEK